MTMPFIISKTSRARYIWILSLVIATVSVWAGVGHLRVSAQKSDPVINKIYVRGTEPGTADQNSFIETFKVDAGSNGTDDLGPRNSAAPGLSPDVSSSLRISQVYTRGGEAGATYQNDFVEVFNAGSTAVDINGWALVVITFEGATQQSIGARFNTSFSVPPGMHLLFRFNGNGTAGQATPGEYPIVTDISLGSTSGQIMLLSPSQNLPTGCPTSFSQTGQVTDFVGYGTSSCFEGAVAPVPPANQSLTRIGGGCTDTDNNANDFALQAPNPRISTSTLTPCGSTAPTTPVVNFSAAQYTVAENAGNATITVIRSGTVSVPVTVNFATANGTATAGSDYTAASGTLSFAANELQKTFNVPITDDSAVESSETVSLTLSGPTGTAVLGSPSSATLTITDNDSTTPPPSTSNSNLRISQIYTRGGEAGATYQNDFVEVFNAGSTAVDINGWAMVVITFEGTTQQAIGSRFNSSFLVPPGMHLLFRFNGNGTVGQPLPGEFPIITDISLGSTSGQVMLLSPTQNLPTGCPASFGLNGAVADFVGYGTSTCFEGAVAPVPPANQSLTRIGGGCTDTDNNANDFALQAPNPRISTSPLTPCGSTAPTTPVVNFSATQYTVAENGGNATITVIRSGVVSVPVTVNFATANGTATAGSDYTAASGTLSFAANELQKTFSVPITDDSTVESAETVSLTLSGPTGTAVLGSPSTATLTIQDNDGTPPPSSNSNLRISQIYTRGGEAGATYQNDFVEVFNAGSTAVDINGWAMVVITFEGTTQQAIGSRFNSSFSVPPGMHLLFRFRGNGTAGQPLPGEFPIINDISLGSTSGQVMLLSPSQTLPAGCPASFGQNGAVTDFVGYGTTTCFEGAPAPVPPANQSLTRIGGGCTDTDNNANDFALQAPNPRISTSPLTPCGSSAPQTPVLNFSATQYTVAENAGNATITVIRSGVVSVPVTVNFATANGTATAGSDYTAASGTLSFAANELQKTFNVPITDDTAVESGETVSLTLSGPTGTAVLGSPSSATLTIQDNDGTTPPPSSNSNLRISQVYTRGGEAGATYQNDFVEVFNAGSTAVNINGWAMVVNTFEGTTQQAIGARFNSNFSMPPGMHLLFRFRGNGTVGQPVPGEYPIINDISLGSTSGQIMLLSPTQALPAGCPASFGQNGAVTDFVGYGTTTCFEGAPAPVPPANKSLTRNGGGCTDTDNNASDFPLADPNPRISSSALTPCGSSSSTPQATVVNFAIGDPGSFPIIGTTNFAIINKTSAFVDQHYHDFLSRFSDTAGLEFWVNNIESCGNDLQCREVKRIDTSASFFLSHEFQQSGYLVERFYKVGYGDGTGTSTFGGQHQLPVPIVRMNEFFTDTQRIGQGVVVLAAGWEETLANNKQAYAQEFVQTARFTAANAFPTTMTPAQFVDKLNSNAGNVLSAAERTTAINLFGGAANSSNVTARAQAVRQVVEDTNLYNAEYNRAFVLAEYFGYLRRNPNEGLDNDYTGYDFWLTKLNQFGGDYHRAEMVKAFISSIEYTNRVGQ